MKTLNQLKEEKKVLSLRFKYGTATTRDARRLSKVADQLTVFHEAKKALKHANIIAGY